MRQIVMLGFPQAQNCTNLVSSWRHPGCFDDRLVMPDRCGNDHARTAQSPGQARGRP